MQGGGLQTGFRPSKDANDAMASHMPSETGSDYTVQATGAIFFLRSQKEYGKKNLPREGLAETAPPLEPTPVCISSHRHMPGDAFAAYRGGTQEMLW